MLLEDLGQLLAGCLAGSFVVVLVAWYRAKKEGGELPGLEPGWSFSESWASNVTIGSAALLAVLGSSDVVASVLGEDADVLGVVIVASAVAAGLVAIAPLVVKALVAESGSVTVMGLFIAATLTLTGASFEVLVLALNADQLVQGNAWLIVGIAILALLALYGYRSLEMTFKLTEPPPESESDTIRGARLIAAAIAGARTFDLDSFASQWGEVSQAIEPTRSPGKRRTSSIL